MDPEELAKQLKKPSGNEGITVGNMMSEGNRKMYHLALDHINLKDDQKILEIGFGNGKLIPEIFIKASRIKYYGIDYSTLMVNEASSFIKEKKLESDVTLMEGNVSSLPFEDNFFDKVLTVNTLYFWENPTKDAKEIYRVLKPGSSFLLVFRPKEMAEKLPFTKTGFQLYTLEEAKSLLLGAGFTLLNHYYQEEGTATIQGNAIQFASQCLIGTKDK